MMIMGNTLPDISDGHVGGAGGVDVLEGGPVAVGSATQRDGQLVDHYRLGLELGHHGNHED